MRDRGPPHNNQELSSGQNKRTPKTCLSWGFPFVKIPSTRRWNSLRAGHPHAPVPVRTLPEVTVARSFQNVSREAVTSSISVWTMRHHASVWGYSHTNLGTAVPTTTRDVCYRRVAAWVSTQVPPPKPESAVQRTGSLSSLSTVSITVNYCYYVITITITIVKGPFTRRTRRNLPLPEEISKYWCAGSPPPRFRCPRGRSHDLVKH